MAEQIMAYVIAQITALIQSMGYLGISLCMIVESCNTPVPSEFILPFGGYLASRGQLSFWGAVLAGTVGGTIGSTISYYIGRLGGQKFLQRYGRYLGLPKHRLDTAEKWLAKYGRAAAFVTRLIPGVRTFYSLPAGAVKVNVRDFIIFTFAGTLVWSTILTYVGFVLGENWKMMQSWLDSADLVIPVIVVAAAVYYLGRYFSKVIANYRTKREMAGLAEQGQ